MSSPLVALKSVTKLTFMVAKDTSSYIDVDGVRQYSKGSVDCLHYDIYLKGAYSNPYEFVSLELTTIPLTGYLLNPIKLDDRVAIGTTVAGFFQGVRGQFTRVFADRGIPPVSKVIGDKVAFIFTTKVLTVDFE
jgi:hypothetical protein